MAKDKKNDNEFVNIDIPSDTSEKTKPDSADTPDRRPVRRAEPVLDDPIADSETGEDIYSGRYKRSEEDRGIYTGGTSKERIASQIGPSDLRRKRLERRRREKRKKTRRTILLCLVIIVGAAAGVKYYQSKQSDLAETTTAAVTETASASDESTPATNWEKDTNSDILTLVQNYYTALAAADTDTLSNLLVSGAEVDAEEIKQEGEFIESYQDIATYVTNGNVSGEYAVYIAYSMKFKDIATPAPGLVPAYVKTADDGSLKLMRYVDFDSDITSYMSKLSETNEVKKLTEEVNTAFSQAQESDADLKNFISALSGETTAETSGESAAAAVESTTAAGESTTAAGESTTAAGETTTAAGETTTAAGETTTAAGETTTAAAAENTFTESTTGITFTETDDIQYVTTAVKLRPSPTTDGNEYVTLEIGTWVHVTGTSEKWMKVTLKDGRTGYVYRKYLSIYKPETNAEE